MSNTKKILDVLLKEVASEEIEEGVGWEKFVSMHKREITDLGSETWGTVLRSMGKLSRSIDMENMSKEEIGNIVWYYAYRSQIEFASRFIDSRKAKINKEMLNNVEKNYKQ